MEPSRYKKSSLNFWRGSAKKLSLGRWAAVALGEFEVSSLIAGRLTKLGTEAAPLRAAPPGMLMQGAGGPQLSMSLTAESLSLTLLVAAELAVTTVTGPQCRAPAVLVPRRTRCRWQSASKRRSIDRRVSALNVGGESGDSHRGILGV